jgi:hypothetical protein
MLTVILLFTLVNSELIKYQFSDNTNIVDKGTHLDEKIDLVLQGKNGTTTHLGASVFVFDGKDNYYFSSVKGFSFLKNQILQTQKLNVTIEVELNKNRIGGEFCIFCVQSREVIQSLRPINLCQDFDFAITWVGRSLRFYLKSSAKSCEASSHFIFIKNDWLRKRLKLTYVYDHDEIFIYQGSEQLFTEKHRVVHDISTWNDPQYMFIGPLITTTIENELKLRSIIIDDKCNSALRVNVASEQRKYFTGIGGNPDKKIENEGVTQHRRIVKTNVLSDSIPIKTIRTTEEPTPSKPVVSTLVNPKKIVATLPIEKKKFFTQSINNDDNNDEECQEKPQVCRCDELVGYKSFIASSSFSIKANRCLLSNKHEYGKCCGGSCKCQKDVEPTKNECYTCKVPIYWSYFNGDIVVPSPSDLKFNLTTNQQVYTLQHYFDEHSVRFERGNHWVVFQSIVTFAKSCFDVVEFRLTVESRRTLVGDFSFQYELNNQWQVSSQPILTFLKLDAIVPERDLEFLIFEKSILSRNCVIRRDNDESIVVSNSVDTPVLLPAGVKESFTWVSKSIGNTLYGQIKEYYINITNSNGAKRDTSKLSFTLYNVLRRRYGISTTMDRLYRKTVNNVQTNGIVTYQDFYALNQTFLIRGGSQHFIGPFRLHDCVKINVEDFQSPHICGSEKQSSWSNVDFCVTDSQVSSVEQERREILDVSTNPTYNLESKIANCNVRNVSDLCTSYDYCGVCNGDNSTCLACENCKFQQCLEEYTKCDVRPLYTDPLDASQTIEEILNTTYVLQITSTVSTKNDTVNVLLKCINSNNVNVVWHKDYDELKSNCSRDAQSLLQSNSIAFVKLKDIYKCVSSSSRNSSTPTLPDVEALKNLAGIIDLEIKGKDYKYKTNCKFNIHTEIDLPTNVDDNSYGKIYVTGFLINSIHFTVKKVYSYVKNFDLLITLQISYKHTNDNSTLSQVEIIRQSGTLFVVKEFTECKLVGGVCNHFLKISTLNEYFLTELDLKSILELNLEFGNHQLRESILIIHHYESRVQVNSQKKLKPSNKPVKLELCFTDEKRMKPAYNVFPGERSYVEMKLVNLKNTSQCFKNHCPLSNSKEIEVKLVNICVVPIDEHLNTIRSCDKARHIRWTLYDSRGQTPVGGVYWKASFQKINNCSSALLFSYYLDKCVVSNLVNKKIFFEVFWNAYDTEQKTLRHFTEFDSIDRHEQHLDMSNQFTAKCRYGYWDERREDCLNTFFGFSEFSETTRNLLLLLFFALFFIFLYKFISCFHYKTMSTRGYPHESGHYSNNNNINNNNSNVFYGDDTEETEYVIRTPVRYRKLHAQ